MARPIEGALGQALGGGQTIFISPETLGFLSMFTNPLLAGIVFAGLFAAIMSTSDAFLNIGTAAIIHDIPKAIQGKSIKNDLFWL